MSDKPKEPMRVVLTYTIGDDCHFCCDASSNEVLDIPDGEYILSDPDTHTCVENGDMERLAQFRGYCVARRLQAEQKMDRCKASHSLTFLRVEGIYDAFNAILNMPMFDESEQEASE